MAGAHGELRLLTACLDGVAWDDHAEALASWFWPAPSCPLAHCTARSVDKRPSHPDCDSNNVPAARELMPVCPRPSMGCLVAAPLLVKPWRQLRLCLAPVAVACLPVYLSWGRALPLT